MSGLILPRRGFLRGLATLPLIGGGVALTGNPTAAAEPVTSELLWEYETWLLCEASAVGREVHPYQERGIVRCFGPACEWHRADPGPASSRAAVVLAAVGVDWKAEYGPKPKRKGGAA